jgi:hypothetical protein
MNDHRIRNRFVTLADLAAQAPQMYQLLNRVGLQRRRHRATRVAQSAGWFGAGVALGTGIATLLTPESGPEMRRRLSKRAQRVREYVAPRANGDAAEKAQERA